MRCPVLTPARAPQPKCTIKVVLAAYMAGMYNALVPKNDKEEKLVKLSRELVEALHRVCDAAEVGPQQEGDTVTPFPGLREEDALSFPELVAQYFALFKDWKIGDEIFIKQEAVKILNGLKRALEEASPSDPIGSTVRETNLLEQQRVRWSVLQCTGVDGLREVDAQCGNQDLPLPEKPRSVVTDEGFEARTEENMRVAHELMLDENFSLEGRPAGSRFAGLGRNVARDTVDRIVQGVCDEQPSYVGFIKGLVCIRQGLLEMCEGGPLAGEARNVIDPAAMRDAAEEGRLGWDGCVQKVVQAVEFMDRLRAPDAETVANWAAVRNAAAAAENDQELRHEALCEAVQFMWNRLNRVRLEAANAKLRGLVPTLRIRGPDCEREYTRKLVEAGLSLQHVEAWLIKTAREEVEAGRLSAQDLAACQDETLLRVLEAGVCALVTGSEPLTKEKCPATLHLDLVRLQAWRRALRATSLSTTVLLGLLGHGVCSGQGFYSEETLRPIKAFFETYEPAEWDASAVPCALDAHLETCGASQEFRDLVRIFAQEEDSTNRVRIELAWREAVATGSLPEEHVIHSIANRLSLAALLQHARKARDVLNLNLRVHGTSYRRVLQTEVF